MNSFSRKKIKEFKKSDLTIHWWNFGSKTLDFQGTAEEYLKRENVKYSFKSIKDEHLDFERIKFKASMSVGSMNFKFDGYDPNDLIRMAINIRLTYLGDKSQFKLDFRTRTINH